MAVVEGKTRALCRDDDGEISISKNFKKIFSDPDHPLLKFSKRIQAH